MSLEIKTTIAPKIGFASHQNAVPVLKELELVNSGDQTYENLVIELSADPAFIEAKVWRIDCSRPGSTTQVTDRDVKLHAGFLADITERVLGEIVLTVSREGEVLVKKTFPVQLLARNQWGGCGSMPELLPAFCMPNDPAVDRVLKAASDVLLRAGKPAGIDGYKSKSRTRTWELASAIWSAVAGLEISYAFPPASFEQEGQKVRTPGAILEGRLATCLDTTLLFASALEQANLKPILILKKDHAFLGVWLQPQEFSQLVTEEASAVRKRVDLDELVVFETTLVTQSPRPGFSNAVDVGKRQLTDEDFRMAVDVSRARIQGIQPLAVPTQGPPARQTSESPPEQAVLEEAPKLPAFDAEDPPELGTPADKVAHWQRKLLDLTTRNRLLHLPEKSKIVQLLCPDPGALEDRLAGGDRIKVLARPDLEAGGRDATLYAQKNREDLYDRYAREALERGEVVSTLSKAELESELIDLYRKSRSDMNEGGANTLFLAIGFLKWRKSAEDPRIYRAPLILLPVKLERKSALSGVKMVMHEDEARFNLTLLELLRQDFELTIPVLEGPLPTDESGVDVPLILNSMRQAVRDISGFEVSGETVLGTFSFAKYLMWKDLTDRRDQLVKNPLVRHLLGTDGGRFRTGGDFPRPEELDQKVNPAGLFTPLPADSSQLAAVVASANGCSFVLDGPPGTGKSQTIANMIAHNLALGRRVLFVAEKMAALEVVYRRLKEKGLGEFCLEIHSNKTSKVDVLRQLERAWDTRDALSPAEWAREAGEVLRLRDRLNKVVSLLHQPRSNGMTLHQAIGRVMKESGESRVRFSWAKGTCHDAGTMGQLREIARRLDLNLGALAKVPMGFGVIACTEWSNGWQESMVACVAEMPSRMDAFVAARDGLVAAVQLPVPTDRDQEIDRFISLIRLLLETHGRNFAFAFTPDANDRIASARRALDLLTEYSALEKQLSIPYAPEAARRINIQQVDQQWAEANKKFWFLATLAKKQVARALAEQGGVSGAPDVVADSPKLHRMRALLNDLDRLAPALSGIPGWSMLGSERVKVEAAMDLAERLRSAIAALATAPNHLIEIRASIRKLVVDANELLGGDGVIASAAARCAEAVTQYRRVADRFRELCCLSKDVGLDFATLREAVEAIQNHQPQLKSWCDWCRVRDEAVKLGVSPLIEAIENGSVPSGQVVSVFETAYARWFAAGVIDSEPCLRNFVSVEHMSDIQAYRQMDDKLSQLSVRYIRARLCGLIPAKDEVGKRDGFGILKHELQKQRRHKPLRQLISEMGEAMTRLAPCMLMSPLSIAQYLPAELELFDLVIFDEASQIAPWDAIGSIARAKQVVIAGDPRQMPPTSFFNRAVSVTDDETDEDMESILDECLGAGVPSHGLSWHYRSRHESLIAFSNHRYYESKLITFPAAVTRSSAVTWRKVDGVYAKGDRRTNQAEAQAMVAEAVKRLTDPEFVGRGKSLAIVTLNAEQQKLVEDLLDQARQARPEIERFFKEDLHEPVVVKNLETVQGDERDLIMLGIGYGPTEPGSTTMSMNFGPLNRDGGWRRLNVAVTRARQEMIVFTSFEPSMVDLNRTSARAVRDLKHFIEFANLGPRALAEAVNGSLGGHESPFEATVAEELSRLGWQVIPQIGVSRFRIDLGIVHPDRPGDYLAGIECDGAAYHSAATARDRDKVRAVVLQGLGWSLLRVWSTDWWVDRQGALKRLHLAIQVLLEVSRTAAQPKPADLLAAAPANTSGAVLFEASSDGAGVGTRPGSATAGRYEVTDFEPLRAIIIPAQFYAQAYDEALSKLILHVLDREAPILDELLVQRIAYAHGFQKAGRLIRERVMDLAGRNHHLREDPVGGRFVWPTEAVVGKWSQYRIPGSEPDLRSIEEIAFEELRAAFLDVKGPDVAVEVARIFGIRRLAAANRERLEAVLKIILPESGGRESVRPEQA